MPGREKEHVVNDILKRRVSAIIRTNDAGIAADAIEAAIAGGFRMVEFTLTTPDALELIARFSKRRELLVGAGTVLTPEQARDSINAGASFLVSPACDPVVINEARRLNAPFFAGCFTPTEMQNADRLGADFVKLFPSPGNVAEFIASVLGPFPRLRIFPTAGVSPGNIQEILSAGAAGAGFTRSLFDPADLAARNYSAIQERAALIISRVFPS